MKGEHAACLRQLAAHAELADLRLLIGQGPAEEALAAFQAAHDACLDAQVRCSVTVLQCYSNSADTGTVQCYLPVFLDVQVQVQCYSNSTDTGTVQCYHTRIPGRAGASETACGWL
eukprot:57660-Pyramimonas_sp.AAC.2